MFFDRFAPHAPIVKTEFNEHSHSVSWKSLDLGLGLCGSLDIAESLVREQYNTIQYSFITVADKPLQSGIKYDCITIVIYCQ